MKPRERIACALNCKIPDRVPVFDFLFSPKLQKEVLGYSTELFDGESQIKLSHKLGLDAAWIPINGYCGLEEEVHKEDEKYKDEWGITYIKKGWPIMAQIDVPIKNRKDWQNYSLPDPMASHRTNILHDSIKANEYDLAIFAGLLGPFTMMYWYFTDLENLSLMIYDDPLLITKMCNAFTDWTLKAAEAAYKTGKIDAFVLADDWGSTTGLLMSPQHCKKFFLKPFADIVQGLKKFNLPVIMHNDGRIIDILDDLVATGINGYHPVEKAAGMDLTTVKNRYKQKLCPIGNINNKTTMVSGTPADVEQEALECIKIAAADGGYILATDHSLHDDIPIENIYAYIGVAKKYGTYPLNV
jgi:uroporphyrinogen decarboxylase